MPCCTAGSQTLSVKYFHSQCQIKQMSSRSCAWPVAVIECTLCDLTEEFALLGIGYSHRQEEQSRDTAKRKLELKRLAFLP